MHFADTLFIFYLLPILFANAFIHFFTSWYTENLKLAQDGAKASLNNNSRFRMINHLWLQICHPSFWLRFMSSGALGVHRWSCSRASVYYRHHGELWRHDSREHNTNRVSECLVQRHSCHCCFSLSKLRGFVQLSWTGMSSSGVPLCSIVFEPRRHSALNAFHLSKKNPSACDQRKASPTNSREALTQELALSAASTSLKSTSNGRREVFLPDCDQKKERRSMRFFFSLQGQTNQLAPFLVVNYGTVNITGGQRSKEMGRGAKKTNNKHWCWGQRQKESWSLWGQNERKSTDLAEQFHVQVFKSHRSVHQLLLLKQQHKQAALHVSQQVAGAVGVDAVVADDGTLLHTIQTRLARTNKKRWVKEYSNTGRRPHLFFKMHRLESES